MTQEYGKAFKVYRQDLSMAATFQGSSQNSENKAR